MLTRVVVISAVILSATACAGGDTDLTDTDPVDTSCTFVLPPSLFTFSPTAAGSSVTASLELEARCPEAIEVTLAWRDPHSGIFQVEGPMTRTLEPRTLTPVEITFSPNAAGEFSDSLVLTPDARAGGGVITVFEGTGI